MDGSLRGPAANVVAAAVFAGNVVRVWARQAGIRRRDLAAFDAGAVALICSSCEATVADWVFR